MAGISSQINISSYELEVLSPFFYSSFEGNVIHTEKIISATALIYALADTFRLRDKDYILFGSKAQAPNYEEILDFPVFVTDAIPAYDSTVAYTSVEFRSTQFLAEGNISLNRPDNPYPEALKTANKQPFYKQERRYIGIDTGSKFRTVIYSSIDFGNEFLLNIGIKRTGEIRLKKSIDIPKYLTLNLFLLNEIYHLPIEKLMQTGTKIERFGDYRLKFIHNIALEYFKTELLPLVIEKWRK